MDSDRRDFLERQEARRRRRQQRLDQKPPTPRVSPSAGSGSTTSMPSPTDQKRTAPSAASAPISSAGQAPAARAPLPKQSPALPPALTKTPDASTPARKTADAARVGTQPASDGQRASAPKPAAGASADQQEHAPTGGVKGRRTAARREERPGAASLPPEPRPSLLARTIVWGTAALCALLILATIGEAWTVQGFHQQIDANQQVVNQLQTQQQSLKQSIQQLQQAQTIEQEARKLGYIFPGDQPVVIVPGASPPATTQPPAPASSPGWWGFWPDWLKLFFGG